MAESGMTYEASGVSYDSMDPFKIAAQRAARETANNINWITGGEFCEFEPSRGESVYLVEAPGCYLAHVEEGLGTKNLVADAMYALTGKPYYANIAQDTVAMIVNDMATLGAQPLSVAMHLAVGDSKWFNNTVRSDDLIAGWERACFLARCTWGGGETPTLKGIVNPEAAVLSGSGMGVVTPKQRLLQPENIRDGDAIIICRSSGIHANGLTLARQIANKLPEGYLTKLSDGRTYGETLLDPTYIYVPLVQELLGYSVEIHYAVNVTGHGWRKLMRATESFTYVIEELPAQLPIFDFIQEHGPVNDREAYGNLNMGAGFALYVPDHQVRRVMDILELESHKEKYGYTAYRAGYIEKSDTKRVVIEPKGLVYAGETLAVR